MQLLCRMLYRSLRNGHVCVQNQQAKAALPLQYVLRCSSSSRLLLSPQRTVDLIHLELAQMWAWAHPFLRRALCAMSQRRLRLVTHLSSRDYMPKPRNGCVAAPELLREHRKLCCLPWLRACMAAPACLLIAPLILVRLMRLLAPVPVTRPTTPQHAHTGHTLRARTYALAACLQVAAGVHWHKLAALQLLQLPCLQSLTALILLAQQCRLCTALAHVAAASAAQAPVSALAPE